MSTVHLNGVDIGNSFVLTVLLLIFTNIINEKMRLFVCLVRSRLYIISSR